MRQLIDFVRPPDNATPRQLTRWRWNVAVSLMACFTFGAWSLTEWGFARASDVEKKIASAVAPLSKEVGAVKAEQREQREIIEQTRELAIENQAADYEGKIVDFRARQCRAPSDEAAATWRALVLDYQSRYLKLTGRPFNAPSCADL